MRMGSFEEELEELKVSIFGSDVKQIVPFSIFRVYEVFLRVEQKLHVKKQIILNCKKYLSLVLRLTNFSLFLTDLPL